MVSVLLFLLKDFRLIFYLQAKEIGDVCTQDNAK